MLKKIDLYIIKKFLGTYFFSIILIIGIAVIFDLTEKIDNFSRHEAPIDKIIFDYYLNFIPYFANLFSALFTFISVIFFTSKLAYNTEIVAILSSGVSFNRILRPYIISACLIGLFSFFLSSYIIPPSNKVRLDFELKYIKGKKNPILDRNVHIELSPGRLVYIHRFKSAGEIGEKFSLETFENGSLKSKLTADLIIYDSTDIWIAQNYLLRTMDGTNETLTHGDSMSIVLKMKPEEFVNTKKPFETMKNHELAAHIKKQNDRGVGNTAPFIIELHQRYASAFSAILLSLIGVSIASRKVRGGIGLHIMFGLVISFAYIFFSKLSMSFSTSGDMDPALSVWISNILFSTLAIYLYRKAQK